MPTFSSAAVRNTVFAILLAGSTASFADHPVTPAVATSTTQAGPGSPDPARPNIILLTTDDQAWSDMPFLPRTRRVLSNAGITFDHALSPHPLCCPARAEIVTGQLAQNNGVHSNGGPYGGFPSLREPGNTLPVWLRQAGYSTGFVGKYLNQYAASDGNQPGWDYWNAAATNAFGYYDYTMVHDGIVTTYHDLNSSDLVTRDVTDLIGRWAPRAEPFFIWGSYYAPHGVCVGKGDCAAPPDVAPADAGLWKGVVATSLRKPSFDELDVSDKPSVIRQSAPLSRAGAQRLFTARIRALARVDVGVESIVRALEAAGELDNTLLIFTTDNGYLVGEHRYLGKVLAYDEAVHVPLLVRGPGIPAGVHRGQVATTVDLAATILDAAQADPGRVQDGRSLMPYMTRNLAQPDRTVLVQAGPRAHETNPLPWMYRGVRTRRYTYVHWTRSGFEELYDRRYDRWELANVAHRPEYARVLRTLRHRRATLHGCSGADCWGATFTRVPAPRADRGDLVRLFARIGR